MTEKTATTAAGSADHETTKRRRRSERLTRIMWAYTCGAITLLSFAVDLGASFIPLGFGVLCGVLLWQLIQTGERRHSALAGAMALGSILIRSTYNWPMIHRDIAG
jgi:hypothetical protein